MVEGTSSSTLVPIHESIYQLLAAGIGAPCGHDTVNPIIIPHDNRVFTSIQTGILCVSPPRSACTLVSAHGNMATILAVLSAIQGYIRLRTPGETSYGMIIQGKPCIICAFGLVEQKFEMGLRYGCSYESAAIFCTIAADI